MKNKLTTNSKWSSLAMRGIEEESWEGSLRSSILECLCYVYINVVIYFMLLLISYIYMTDSLVFFGVATFFETPH